MSHLPRTTDTTAHATAPTGLPPATSARDEDGSMVAEYGLIAVVAATIAGILITWASGGAMETFFSDLLDSARNLVGS